MSTAHRSRSLIVLVALGVAGLAASAAEAQLQFYPITPCRIVDTRSTSQIDTVTPMRGTFTVGETRSYTPSQSTNCPGLPTNAGGWALHVNYNPATLASVLTVYPADMAEKPGTGTILSYVGVWTGSNPVVPAGSGGAIKVYSQYVADVVIDVNGYFAP
jgi:hypothetical protein